MTAGATPGAPASTAAAGTALEVDILHRQGAFTLDVRFRAGGGVTALFGPSGSGKSTLVGAIGGLIRPARGRVAVGGTVLMDTDTGVFVPRHRRRIGYVFQEGRLFPHLTVRRNLLFGRAFTPRRHRRSDGVTFEGVVDLLDVGHLLDRRPGGLSGGEKQRVAIGRALLAHPRLLLMDEPLASLDAARKAEILPLLERLRDEAGVPIVYVSHAPGEVARLATTVVVLDGGRVVSVGPAREVLGERPGASPPAEGRGDGVVLDGRVAGHDARFGLTVLATAAGELVVPRLDRPVGAAVRVGVRARDVVLCLTKPHGLGALNVLPGTVAEVGGGGGAWVEVRLVCGEGAGLLARVARKTVEDLAFVPGRAVFAVVQTVSLDGDAGVAAPAVGGGQEGVNRRARQEPGDSG